MPHTGFPMMLKTRNGWIEIAQALPPSAFAVVLATGIVSVASRQNGFMGLAWALFAANAVIYLSIASLSVINLVFHPRHVADSLARHNTSAGYFTLVAGTSVLGEQFTLLMRSHMISLIFYFLSVASWVIVTYAFFLILSLKRRKPEFSDAINGGWLLAVVANQSTVILGETIVFRFPDHASSLMMFTDMILWLFGIALYVLLITLILYRVIFFTVVPAENKNYLYWINMGAMAISTLAGTWLITNGASSALLASLRPFIEGVTLLCWSTATWWIVYLCGLSLWQMAYQGGVAYSASVWSVVFPLGMYAVSTGRLAAVMALPFIRGIAEAFFGIAMLAYLFSVLGFFYYIRNFECTSR